MLSTSSSLTLKTRYSAPAIGLAPGKHGLVLGGGEVGVVVAGSVVGAMVEEEAMAVVGVAESSGAELDV